MKEVIMKKLLFWIVLIVGTGALLGSCAKKDGDTAATTSASSTTASGSITVGSETLSGTYVSTCNTDFAAAAGSSIFPSDVKSGKSVMVVTSGTTFSDELLMYTDTSCSTPSATIKNERDNVTVGSASGTYYQVTYNEASFKVTAHTAVAQDNLTAALIGNISDIDLTTLGQEFSTTGNSQSNMNLWSVTSTTFQQGEESTSTQPTAMDSMVMTKE
jgi:hypothetical protein